MGALQDGPQCCAQVIHWEKLSGEEKGAHITPTPPQWAFGNQSWLGQLPGASMSQLGGGKRWEEMSSSRPIKEAGMGRLSYKRLKSSWLIDYEF